jgi:hypothetical protein
MNKHLWMALPLALTLSAGAFAKDRPHDYDRDSAVDTLKGTLTNINGFEVEDIREGDGGVACITYHVSNDQNGQSQERAVVHGDKVLHEVTGNTRFEKAWNSKCAGK